MNKLVIPKRLIKKIKDLMKAKKRAEARKEICIQLGMKLFGESYDNLVQFQNNKNTKTKVKTIIKNNDVRLFEYIDEHVQDADKIKELLK